jgi:hypothetical protein
VIFATAPKALGLQYELRISEVLERRGGARVIFELPHYSWLPQWGIYGKTFEAITFSIYLKKIIHVLEHLRPIPF